MRARPLDQQLEELTGRLCREYGDRGVPADAVVDAVRTVRAEFAAATVLTYLPVLIERAVRERLIGR